MTRCATLVSVVRVSSENPAATAPASSEARAQDEQRWIPWLLAILAVALVAWQIQHYYPFFSDDGFISLRYSQRLLEGKGLTWTDGERVEGYSNLSYVLLCAFVGYLCGDLVIAARIVGMLGLAMMLASMWVLQRRRALQTGTALAWCVLCSVSSSVVWAIGGLEATLYTGLLLLGYAKVFSNPIGPGEGWPAAIRRTWPLALACWTRPDGPLFVIILALALFAAGKGLKDRIRSAFFASIIPFLAFCAQLTFRRMYYNDWVPNTAHIKAKADFERFEEGLDYLGGAFEASGYLLVFSLIGLTIAFSYRRERLAVLTTFSAAVAWSLYICFIGGDIFPAWRHALPTWGMLTMCGAVGLQTLLDAIDQSKSDTAPRLRAFLAFGIAGIVALAQAQRKDPGNTRAVSERWEWDAAALGPLYRRFKEKDPLLAVEPAGALPFFSELNAVDMYGLCDAHIARQEPQKHLGLAHDHGDGEYVWMRKPDLVLFLIPTGGHPRSSTGRVMKAKPDFNQLYKRVQFRALSPTLVEGTIYVRRDGKVGIHKRPDQITVPAYMFEGGSVTGFPIDDQGVGAHLAAGESARSGHIDVPGGLWEIALSKASPMLGVTLTNRSNEDVLYTPKDRGWQVQGPAKLEISVGMPGWIAGTFESLILRKTTAPEPRKPALPLRAQASVKLKNSSFTPEFVPVPPLQSPPRFTDTHGTLLQANAAARSECKQRLPAVDDSVRLDTYDLGEQDKWTGEALGPTYKVPPRGLAYACISGARQGAGLRLRDLDSGVIIRSWSGNESLHMRSFAEDLSGYEGATVRFEAYDDRKNAWGHVRVFGLGIGQARKKSQVSHSTTAKPASPSS